MSDKNRNMNDINDQKTAEQQAFSEEIRRHLAEPGSGKPTLDEFKVMVYKDREKRRKKRNALVACIVAAFIVGFLTFDDLVPEVGADKNPKETIQTEDGVIIEDGGWGSSTGENDIWKTEDWSEVIKIKEECPELIIPYYWPKEYVFKQFVMESIIEGDMICQYIFTNKDEKILEMEFVIINTEENTTNINNIARVIDTEKGEVYLLKGETKNAVTQTDEGIIVNIWGDIADAELVKIVENLND